MGFHKSLRPTRCWYSRQYISMVFMGIMDGNSWDVYRLLAMRYVFTLGLSFLMFNAGAIVFYGIALFLAHMEALVFISSSRLGFSSRTRDAIVLQYDLRTVLSLWRSLPDRW